jgi:hypothetical protein
MTENLFHYSGLKEIFISCQEKPHAAGNPHSNSFMGQGGRGKMIVLIFIL